MLAFIAIAVYGVIAQRYQRLLHLRPTAAWLILLPIGVVAWALVHASGIHATIAGVLLGFMIPVLHKKADQRTGRRSRARRGLRASVPPAVGRFRGACLRVLLGGVAIGGGEGFVSAFADPVVVGIVLALVIGKPLGITAATWIITRIRRINLDPSLDGSTSSASASSPASDSRCRFWSLS